MWSWVQQRKQGSKAGQGQGLKVDSDTDSDPMHLPGHTCVAKVGPTFLVNKSVIDFMQAYNYVKGFNP